MIQLESDGFIVFPSNLLGFYLHALCEELRPLGEDTPHEVLAEMPRVTAFLNHPLLWGLQEDPLRHLHLNDAPSNKLPDWHRDDWGGDIWPGRRLLLFAYPREVRPDMGPTEVRARNGDPVPIIGPPGMCLLMGSATWHRPTYNKNREWRPMLRFVLREGAG
jgi:hypothetical protein